MTHKKRPVTIDEWEEWHGTVEKRYRENPTPKHLEEYHEAVSRLNSMYKETGQPEKGKELLHTYMGFTSMHGVREHRDAGVNPEINMRVVRERNFPKQGIIRRIFKRP